MLKKTLTYTDFNGVDRTEDFYFNLSKAEVLEMEMTTEGGFAERIEQIVNAKKVPELIALFKKLVMDAYGEKSADGRRFVKSPELSEAFTQTPAYSDMYMLLVTNTDEAVAFVNGIMPAELVQGQKPLVKGVAPLASTYSTNA